MGTDNKPQRSPLFWVPTLFFAEGLPNYLVLTIAGLIYLDRGVSVSRINFWTGLLWYAWAVKPLWSPFIENFQSKKLIVLLFELLAGLGLGLVALCLPLANYFAYTIALLGIVALCSATHDIAADGLYIANLSSKQQAAYAGWTSAFYQVARIFCVSGLTFLAGVLELQMGFAPGHLHTVTQNIAVQTGAPAAAPLGSLMQALVASRVAQSDAFTVGVAYAWMVVFALVAIVMVLLGAYHFWSLPSTLTQDSGKLMRKVFDTLVDVIATFFRKRNILLMIAFIILFRAGEGQVSAIGPLFLKASAEMGGLGLNLQEFGVVYGIATVAMIVGGIMGGFLASWLGLRRAMFFLICAMNLPNLAYVFLSTALPTHMVVIGIALSVEMFGYGFGFVGLILFMMQEVAPGRYRTAHYALATGLMALGGGFFKQISGYVQEAVGYQNFFIWGLICAIPALILSRFIPFTGGTDLKSETTAETASSQ